MIQGVLVRAMSRLSGLMKLLNHPVPFRIWRVFISDLRVVDCRVITGCTKLVVVSIYWLI